MFSLDVLLDRRKSPGIFSWKCPPKTVLGRTLLRRRSSQFSEFYQWTKPLRQQRGDLEFLSSRFCSANLLLIINIIQVILNALKLTHMLDVIAYSTLFISIVVVNTLRASVCGGSLQRRGHNLRHSSSHSFSTVQKWFLPMWPLHYNNVYIISCWINSAIVVIRYF